MTTEALDFYAYWNGAQVADLWTTLALITGTDDYRSLLLCVALFGLICAAAGAAVRYRGGDLIVWIAAMVFIFSAAFVPRVNIAVRDVRSANVQVVQNIPLGIGWPASVISRASYWLTESFETAFGDVDAARYTRFGVAFPQRVVTTMLSVKPITADGKMSLTNFTERCIVPEILENSVKRQELLNAPDINALISTKDWVNPARRVFMNNKVLTCTEAAEELKKTLEKIEIPALESRLRLKLNVDFKDGVNAALSTAIPQAESLMLGVSRTMAESLRQSLMMSAIPDTTMTFAAKAGQAPLSAGVAIARSQGNLASEINYRTLSEMARSALPKLRNILEFTVIGLWPMVFLMMLGTGAGGAMVCRAYFTLLISVSLWAPITAIINYLTLHLDMEPMNQLVNSAGGVTLAAATMIRDAGATSQAMAGSLLWLVPVLAYAVAKGSDLCSQGRSGASFGRRRHCTIPGQPRLRDQLQNPERNGPIGPPEASQHP
ncbi:conjugal transfer protein TraG N-terminal domain-containing protein [uncultured Sutterella sp.]|uniref:conjugal transfer protein TraG N-terminal domain-containing protein n=1 Tax=uncultured Sutterella sp. TaxID=286133 RepID=UPI002670693B|nr:conjugal transfer protein TraG N-terminal domain-containing protein [uncultured Sutterella sp.]